MLFTRIGTFLAYTLSIFAVLRIALATTLAGSSPEAVKRYIGSGTTGEAIDQATYVLFCAIALGVLAEISKSLHRANGRGV